MEIVARPCFAKVPANASRSCERVPPNSWPARTAGKGARCPPLGFGTARRKVTVSGSARTCPVEVFSWNVPFWGVSTGTVSKLGETKLAETK